MSFTVPPHLRVYKHFQYDVFHLTLSGGKKHRNKKTVRQESPLLYSQGRWDSRRLRDPTKLQALVSKGRASLDSGPLVPESETALLIQALGTA